MISNRAKCGKSDLQATVDGPLRTLSTIPTQKHDTLRNRLLPRVGFSVEAFDGRLGNPIEETEAGGST